MCARARACVVSNTFMLTEIGKEWPEDWERKTPSGEALCAKSGREWGQEQRENSVHLTQEGHEGANRGIGSRHFHLKLGLLPPPPKGGGPFDSVCAASPGCAELQVGADRMKGRQERASLNSVEEGGVPIRDRS